MLAFIGLAVRRCRQIIAAFRGNGTAQFQGDVALKSHIRQRGSKFTQKRFFVKGLVVLEIKHRQARAIFQLPGFKAGFLPQRGNQAVQPGKLTAQPLFGVLLGSGILLDAHHVQKRVFCPLCHNPANLFFVHAELVSAGQPEQYGHFPFPPAGALVQQLQLCGRFRCIPSHPGTVIHHPGRVFRRFVHAGNHQLFLRDVQPAADVVFSGGADLKPVGKVPQCAGEEGVGLHGVAQLCAASQRFFQGFHSPGQPVQIKQIGRGAEFFCRFL